MSKKLRRAVFHRDGRVSLVPVEWRREHLDKHYTKRRLMALEAESLRHAVTSSRQLTWKSAAARRKFGYWICPIQTQDCEQARRAWVSEYCKALDAAKWSRTQTARYEVWEVTERGTRLGDVARAADMSTELLSSWLRGKTKELEHHQSQSLMLQVERAAWRAANA